MPPAKTFTIVTPSFNQGKYIEQTIQSVLSQAGDFSIDYIIADGGSTDNSIEIIKKYDELLKSSHYPIKCHSIRYRWWSHKDGGQSQALNQGFKLANGEILAWINSDDFYADGAFQKIIDAFQKNPTADLIYGNGYTITGAGKNVPIVPPKITYRRLLLHGCEIFQPSTFFTKKCFYEIGGIDETLQYAFDYALWLSMAKREKLFHIDEYLASFRLWPESKTAMSSEKFIDEQKLVLKRHTNNFLDPYYFFMFKRVLKKLFPSFRRTSG
jgi:glycosyltransferase involved in cell wall biosynthesis